MKNYKDFVRENISVLKQNYPLKLSKIEDDAAKIIATSGQDNDKVSTQIDKKVKVGALKPAQKEVIPEKALAFALGYLEIKQPDLTDMEAIVSSDLYIMDGHHRWAGATLLNPEMEVKVAYINMPAVPLITSLNIYTKGILKYNGNEGKGDISQWKTLIVKAIDNAVVNGLEGQWPFKDGKIDGSAKKIKEIITKFGNGNLQNGIKKLKANANMLNTEKLPDAPQRIDMPVIKADNGDLKSVLTSLANGKMDILPPFSKKVEDIIPKLSNQTVQQKPVQQKPVQQKPVQQKPVQQKPV